MAYRKLKINKDLIHNCITKAIDKEIQPVESTNKGIKLIRYQLDTNSILDLFYNLDGTTSITWCGREPDLAELIANEIKENCEVDLPEPTRALYLKEIDKDNFEGIIEKFKAQNLTVTDLEDTDYSKRYSISNTMNESIKMHYFPTSGALNFQGKGYTIYSDLLESMEDNVSVDDVLDSNLSANKIESITKDDLKKSMQEALPNTFDFLNGAVANIMSSSFFLTKIENNELPDYSWMVFPVLRGFEGVIKKLLNLKGITINNNFGEVFEPISAGNPNYKFLDVHSTAISDTEYCDLLTECYNYLNANRHGIFHINGIINATRQLTREDAIEMFNEIIDLIETTYSKIQEKIAA